MLPSRHSARDLPVRSEVLLTSSCDDQDRIFSAAFSLLHEAIAQRIFPAASVAITHNASLVALKAFGQFTYEPDSPVTQSSTLFDLASLTKVAATTTMAMILYERGLLDLDAPVIGVVPELAADSTGHADPRRREVTFRMLLAHSSGLPAYEKLFLKAHSRDELLRAAFTTPLSADPGDQAEYSDIGFIILGTALERLCEESLDSFCRREVFGPLSMAHTTFNPSARMKEQIPPTADDRAFRHRIIQGEVQDENAFVLGGVAPHAGLFSTAGDIALFALAMLQSETAESNENFHFEPAGANAAASRETSRSSKLILRPETLALFTRRQPSPRESSRALGWDTPSSPSQSGKYFGPRSFGHLGYTGTSLWIDPDRQLSITLLTNRTWPDCSNQAIRQLRPKFHDAIIEALFPTKSNPI